MRLFLISCITLCSFWLQAAQVSLIIDDMGNDKGDAHAFSLPPGVTFAILPNKPLSTSFSRRAAAQHREVMLHMPMESLARQNQEQGVLISSMQPNEIVETLDAALASVPDAVGMNNHMGSRLTQLSRPMSVTMNYLSKRGLFFVDSRTTRYSKAIDFAQKSGVLNVKRSVFLDHVLQQKSIHKQFLRLIDLAKKRGYAVGIAHPHSQTLEYLSHNLKLLEAHGVSLVKLSDALGRPTEWTAVTEPHSKKSYLKGY